MLHAVKKRKRESGCRGLLVRVGILTEKMAFEQRPEEGEGQALLPLQKDVPGRKTSKCKGPEAGKQRYLPQGVASKPWNHHWNWAFWSQSLVLFCCCFL